MRRMKKVMVFLGLLLVVVSAEVDGKRYISLKEREEQVEQKLKLFNKPAVKSIQSADGDIIDCVNIYKQPAFDHPFLKNHKIKKPNIDLLNRRKETASPATLDKNLSMVLSQVWRRHGSCPEGTVPIRRVQKHHLLKAPSIEGYGQKTSHEITKHEIKNGHILAEGIENYHSSVALLTSGYSYTGAKANINVWNPSVEADDEYTTGQMWLRNGGYNDSDTIEVGWMVNPSVYGDLDTRLFIYWTIDSGKKTGCFDVLCPGFVQLSSEVALGAIIEPVSTTRGQQYFISVEVIKDFTHNLWWLILRNNITVGYWPGEIFKGLNKVATLVEWGGDVYTPRLRSGGPHTATTMGSGAFANEHLGYASFIQEPRIMDYSSTYKYPDPYGVYTPARNCYSGENYASEHFKEPFFYFGGPGRNRYCP